MHARGDSGVLRLCFRPCHGCIFRPPTEYCSLRRRRPEVDTPPPHLHHTYRECTINNTMGFPMGEGLTSKPSLASAADSALTACRDVVDSSCRRHASPLHMRCSGSPQARITIWLRSSEGDVPVDAPGASCHESVEPGDSIYRKQSRPSTEGVGRMVTEDQLRLR